MAHQNSQLQLLESFFGYEISELYKGRPWRANGILMACPVWGDKYIDRLERYCLPSLMAPRNYAALKDRCRLVFFTDPQSYGRLNNYIEGMETIGFDLDMRVIPKELMDLFHAKDPLIKYWILGVCQNVGIQMAKRAGMAFHQIHPDHVVEAGYYENLFRIAEQYDGIAQTGISADAKGAGKELDSFVQTGGSLVIEGRDLGDIGWRHLHKQTKVTIMNKATFPDDLPESHLWTWIGKDKLYLSCCHMNAAYISAKVCGTASPRIPATIDAELPYFMPRKFYVPTAEDGMTFIEISDETKADNPKRVKFKEFAQHCWLKVRYSRDWMPYVEHLCEVPIRQQNEFYELDRIRAEHKTLMQSLLEIRGPDTIATEFITSLGFQ